MEYGNIDIQTIYEKINFYQHKQNLHNYWTEKEHTGIILVYLSQVGNIWSFREYVLLNPKTFNSILT